MSRGRKTALIIGLALIPIIVPVLVVFGGGWWDRFTAEWRGETDVIEQVSADANNVIGAQEWFEETYTEIQATDAKLDQAAADKAANPDDDFYTTNYAGLVSYCLDLVGQYDAEARKISSEAFRDTELPSQINESDPDFDCKESSN